MASFFIHRPIVAIVISIIMVMLGVVVLLGLSVEQYPFLAPPNIRETGTYPGASAEAVEQSVATPIEQDLHRRLLGTTVTGCPLLVSVLCVLPGWERQSVVP